ncbi:MAG: hypothetical protein JNM68_06355 [Dinghuibacter sp.]|nr:hypothetical protein [Dinghuibacter sp.]
MIIRQTSWSSSSVIDFKTHEKDERVTRKINDDRIVNLFLQTIPSYFKTKEYGKGVKELLYKQICYTEDHKIFEPEKDKYYYYDKRQKAIVVVVDLDYDRVLQLNDNDLLEYLGDCYLDATEGIRNLNIKDFDLENYIADFFNF